MRYIGSVIVTFLGFAVLASPVLREEVQALPLSQIGGFRIWEQAPQGFRKSAHPGFVTHFWALRFKNESPKEIGSVTVRLVEFEGTRRAYESKPVTIRSFVNVGVAHRGSLLPWEKSEFDGMVGFDVPESGLRTTGGATLEVVSATGFRRADLHDAGHLASYLRNMRRPEILAQFKRDPSLLKVRNAQSLTTTLMAFGSCDPEVIKYVLAHGGNAKDRTDRGATIMHMAAMNGYVGVLDLAAKLGGNPNAQTMSGRTPLMKSIAIGQPVGWRWLLKHGAKPTLATKAGETAPYVAIQEGQAQALADLVKAGANPRARDAKGRGWLDYCVGNYAFLGEVARYGLPIDGRNPLTGATPLMLSGQEGVPDGTIWFLQHGANPSLKDKKGRTAYDYAALGGINLPYLVQRYAKR